MTQLFSQKFTPLFACFAYFSLVILISGCTSTTQLNQLTQAELPKSPYHRMLSQEYLSFARSEADQSDWRSVKRFSQKGLQAVAGENIMPEPLTIPRALSAQQARQLEEEVDIARHRLEGVLTAKNRRDKPAQTALSLFSFDCWMEQLAEFHQQEDIRRCRTNFYTALARLDGGEIPATRLSPETIENAEEHIANLELPQSHLIFFPSGGTLLTMEAKDKLQEITEVIEAFDGNLAISVIGHSDKQGAAEANQQLSMERALIVEDALRDSGVTLTRIDLRAEGESTPLVPTNDGVAEPLNRRVEIILQ